MSLWLASFGFVIGLGFLVWSADIFVKGATGLAHWLKMPPLLIGMIVIGFGTSAPEMLVSTLSASKGMPLLALGNAYGSNITNILLVLGVCTFLGHLVVHKQILKQELPILMGITLLTLFLAWDGTLSRMDGWILIGVFVISLSYNIIDAMRNRHAILDVNDEAVIKPRVAIFFTLLGIGVLLGSSALLVDCSVNIARHFGVDELVIGLTVVAVGTSLPELVSSIMAMRQKKVDLAIGNIIGSNFFNTLIVAGIALTIHPITEMPSELLIRDIGVMTATTFFLMCCVIYGYIRSRKQSHPQLFIGKMAGVIFLISYIAYTAWIVVEST